MRNAFINELVVLARANQKIVLMVGDLGFSVIEPFRDEFPERFINAGVAEQNMMGIAAGLASEGCHVYVYSIANFPTFRCAEQIRNDVDYHNLPVTIVSVGGGLAYGNLGYSHHAVQDYALMRVMPNMLIAAPGDPMEVRGCMRYLNKNPQPSYLRLGKAGEDCFHSCVPNVEPGKWLRIDDENHTYSETYLTTGATLGIAMEGRRRADGVVRAVHSLPLWGMATKEAQPRQLDSYDRIVTMEDHLIDGGFGSWMMESCISKPELLTRLHPTALDPKVCGTVGSQAVLNTLGGLCV